LKRFDENTAVYGISGILPSTNKKEWMSVAMNICWYEDNKIGVEEQFFN